MVTSSTPLGGAPPASSGVAHPAGGASCFGFCAARAFEEGAAEIGVGPAEAFAASFAFAVAVGAGVARVDDGSFAPALFAFADDLLAVLFAERDEALPFAGEDFAAVFGDAEAFALAGEVFAEDDEALVFAGEAFAAVFAGEVAALVFAREVFAVVFAEDDDALLFAGEDFAVLFAEDDEALVFADPLAAFFFAASFAFAVAVGAGFARVEDGSFAPADDRREGAVFAVSRAAAATLWAASLVAPLAALPSAALRLEGLSPRFRERLTGRERGRLERTSRCVSSAIGRSLCRTLVRDSVHAETFIDFNQHIHRLRASFWRRPRYAA